MNRLTIPHDWNAILENPLIKDAADTDGYMLRMKDLVEDDPTLKVAAEFRFKNRKTSQRLAEIIPPAVFQEQLDAAWKVQMPTSVIDYMKKTNFLRKRAYRKLSRIHMPNLRFQVFSVDGQFDITTDDSLLERAFFPEIYILRIESALFTIFSCIEKNISLEEVKRANREANQRDLEMLKAYREQTGHVVPFGDFACRRPALPQLHEENLCWWLENGPEYLSGTSHVGFAAKYGVRIQASIGHMFPIAQAATSAKRDESLRQSHVVAVQKWIDYCNEVTAQDPMQPAKKVMVTDTFTTAFARNGGITHEQALELDFMRPDSGDPLVEGEADIAFWQKHGRDPKTAGTLFADGLNVEQSLKLFSAFVDRTTIVLARGGDFGNKIAGTLIPKQSTVFKPWYIDGRPAVKLSNDMGKVLSPDTNEVERYRRVFAV